MGEAVMKRFGKIDILILNASQRREVLFKDMTFEEWRNTMSITLDGSFHCIKACLPSMLANRSGNIVTLGGDAVLLGGNRKAHNTTAKNRHVRVIRDGRGCTRRAVRIVSAIALWTARTRGYINPVRAFPGGAACFEVE
jgi:NAD(P)-dependent dehydrogenase (short-subunit alcohol dehydrogenase family)